MIKSHAGFTLIEVMIVIAIIAIITSIAAPRFQVSIETQNLNRQTKDLILLLNTARSQALTLHQEVAVNLNSSVSDTNLEFNWMPEKNNRIIEQNTIFSINFLPNGTVENFNTTTTNISICNSALKKSKRIRLSRMGSVSMLSDGTCT